MNLGGALAPAGEVSFQVVRGPWQPPNLPGRELSHREIARLAMPHSGVSESVREYRSRNLRNIWRGWRRIATARALGIAHLYGALGLRVLRGDGTIEDLGLVSLRVVTNDGVGFIVDAFQNLVELENMKYHGFGTGTNNEAASDAALQTELTTEYATDNTRPTGTTTESSSNVFQSVATFAPDSGGTIAVTEHGIFSQAANSGGVLLDRSKFSAVNVAASADSIVSTYSLTLTAGS